MVTVDGVEDLELITTVSRTGMSLGESAARGVKNSQVGKRKCMCCQQLKHSMRVSRITSDSSPESNPLYDEM
jgi:hypothetical protein